MSTPSKKKYEEALEIVKKYEKRKADLEKLNKDLGNCLNYHFSKFKFDVDKKDGLVVFTGVTRNGEMVLSKSKCNPKDKFEEVIGKLIAVKESVKEDISYIDKYIEEKHKGGWINIGKDSISIQPWSMDIEEVRL